MTHHAKKVVIITEKILLNQLVKLIEDAGAAGYTVFAAGGKGSRSVRSEDRPKVVDEFGNIQIEIITSNDEIADTIAEQVAERYFPNYSGIIYLENVEILRPEKFKQRP